MKQRDKFALGLWIVLYLVFLGFVVLGGMFKLNLGLSEELYLLIYGIDILMCIIVSLWIFKTDNCVKSWKKEFLPSLCPQLYLVTIGYRDYLERVLPGKVIIVIYIVVDLVMFVPCFMLLKNYLNNRKQSH